MQSPSSHEQSAPRQPRAPQGTSTAGPLGWDEPAGGTPRDEISPVPGTPLRAYHLRRPPRRRVLLPLILFAVTCLSTFWAGATDWQPVAPDARRVALSNWGQGLTYMACVLAILLTHELGHFFMTVWYRIPASLPIFIPFPITPIGTMGAVIGMDGRIANRKEIFDIGIAGPLAGLLAAIPILWLGIAQLDLSGPIYGAERYDCPLLVEWMIRALRPDAGWVSEIRSSQLNAFFMAGWVGLLITGLNMLPVSQLDGGHVIYALFGRRAHWIARGFIFAAILFIVLGEALIWSPMVILVILLGTDHPPTADDSVELGSRRIALGCLSLLIPILCFPLRGITMIAF
jgi:membrane-associated protease RseP (regulator of RpoE activity)